MQPGKVGTNIIKTVPSSMISMAKSALGNVTTTSGGKQTIVIAAPKSGGLAGSMGGKVITTVPKVGNNPNAQTQFIVVTTRPGGGISQAANTISKSHVKY